MKQVAPRLLRGCVNLLINCFQTFIVLCYIFENPLQEMRRFRRRPDCLRLGPRAVQKLDNPIDIRDDEVQDLDCDSLGAASFNNGPPWNVTVILSSRVTVDILTCQDEDRSTGTMASHLHPLTGICF